MATREFQETFVSKPSARQSVAEHDIICIGFGSSSIALAIALRERASHVNALFLERQPKSSYVPFTRPPGTYMQLSFLNDLVTQENPRSKFSYLSYLRSTDQLIKFANLGSIQPLREQFGRYLNWCANQFDQQVLYGSEAQTIRPANHDTSNGEAPVDAWDIEYMDVCTGELRKTSAKQVVCAVGMQPAVPSILSNPTISRCVLHPSALLKALSSISKDQSQPLHIVVVGSGLEAAEATEAVYNMRSPLLRVTWLQDNRIGSSESPVTDRLIEHQYTQRIREPDSEKWKLNIHTNANLKEASQADHGRVRLVCGKIGSSSDDFAVTCDSVVAATGYTGSEHKRLFRSLRPLLSKDEISVDDNQAVKFRRGLVQDECGVWLLGTLTSNTEMYDGKMAHIATRSRNLADVLVGRLDATMSNWDRSQATGAFQLHRARL